MKIITVDMENFGAEIKKIIPDFIDRPAQASHPLSSHRGLHGYMVEARVAAKTAVEDLFTPYAVPIDEMCKIVAEQLFKRSDPETSPDAPETSPPQCMLLLLLLLLLLLAFSKLSSTPTLVLLLQDFGAFSKLSSTPALVLLLQDFGVFPTLIDTTHLVNVLFKTVVREIALLVFREDPKHLGMHKVVVPGADAHLVVDPGATDAHLVQMLLTSMHLVVDPGATDAHLVQMMLTFMDLHDPTRRATFAKSPTRRATFAKRSSNLTP
ncbi:hypothetical protein T484DRAFT_1799215 [Baffinella frigidus]|nr:hypothetical protein T484DRAFT_1799215 [Cryptophyta sp. CCMP2293]